MLARARQLAREGQRGTRFDGAHAPSRPRCGEQLPWPLTVDQKQAIREIFDDMTRSERMHRLLMGDVGTGKTVVALFAMLLALENDYQAALMAPTELLAEQHYRTLSQLLAPLGLRAGAAARAPRRGRQARRARGGWPTGTRRLVIGTHALVQERGGVPPSRAGGDRRAAPLRRRAAGGADAARATRPTCCCSAATPIPRSLALTRFGDLDISVLRARPPGRGAVRTALRTPAHRNRVFEFVRDSVVAGGQAYVVLPVIEESERADLRAAETMATTLTAKWPDVRVGLVHGRLKGPERDTVMRAFRDGEVQVLVATTVIEVGIDVPNATRDGDRASRALRPGAAAPAARPDRARRRRSRTASCSRRVITCRSGSGRSRRSTTASGSPNSTSRNGAMATCSGRASRVAIDFRIARFPDDTDLLAEARVPGAGDPRRRSGTGAAREPGVAPAGAGALSPRRGAVPRRVTAPVQRGPWLAFVPCTAPVSTAPGISATTTVLETLPIGRRLAFDAAKGRLWVICPSCARWNLVPFDTRLETIDACERLFRDTRMRFSTDHIGLARLREGLELVRIGEALRPEYAAWRYGDRFASRRRRNILIGTTVGVAGSARMVGLQVLPGRWSACSSSFRAVRGSTSRFRVASRFVPESGGAPLTLTRQDLDAARLEVGPVGARDMAAPLPWGLSVPARYGVPGRWTWPRRVGESVTLTGRDAVQALSHVLPAIAGTAGSRDQVRRAVDLVDKHQSLESIVSRWSAHWSRRLPNTARLTKLAAAPRLALEMLANEEAERRWLEGELRLLEHQWREAERLAAIADELALPAGYRSRGGGR